MIGERRQCPHFHASKCPKNPFLPSHPECKRCAASKDNLWLCLNKDCEQLHCGKNEFHHLRLHLQESNKRKQYHCLFINIHTAEIFCVACKEMIEDNGGGEKSEKTPILKIRTKIMPKLKDFESYACTIMSNEVTGQIQNSEAHRKINQDSVGLFSNQYNHSIHSALQFIAHCSYLKDLILQTRVPKELTVLGQVQKVIREMNEGRYRAVSAEGLDRLLYQLKPELLTYKRKDPLDILLFLLQELHSDLKYNILPETYMDPQHDEWSLYHHKSHSLKEVCPLYDTIDIQLRLNYHCSKCKLNDHYIKKINFLKLGLQKRKRNAKEVEKEVVEYRGQSPLKKRKNSLMSLFFKEEDLPLSVHEMMIDLFRRPLHKQKLCDHCKQPLKKSKIQIERLPKYLLIHISRMVPQGSSIDETPVMFSTADVDFGAFTASKETRVYSFETAIGVEKGFFPVLAQNKHNKQFQIFRNETISYEGKLNPYIICYKMKPHQKSIQLHSEVSSKLQLQQRDRKYLLPDFWMLQLKHGFEGELHNPFICRHHRLKPKIESKEINKHLLDLETYEGLGYQYKGRNYDPVECQRCLDDLQMVEIRRKQEREVIKRLDALRTNLSCMVSLDWIEKWSVFLYKRDQPSYMFKGHPPPGKIDNSSILEGKKCRPHLVPNRDCKIVNYYVWRFLKEVYRGGTEIRYKWTNDGKQNIDQGVLQDIRREGARLRIMLAELPLLLSKNSSTMEQSNYVSEEESQISTRLERERQEH